MKSNYGIRIVSMQSIWYGMTQRIAGTPQERAILLAYTKQALRFADAMSCPNLVFGCPKNRNMNVPDDEAVIIQFLLDIADEAEKLGIIIALEPNPKIYGTNFVNTTNEALKLVSSLKHPALKVNLDFGTIISNKENMNNIHNNIAVINHIHISEPELLLIKRRKDHEVLCNILKSSGYDKYISIEMRKQEDIAELIRIIDYVKRVFA